MKPICFDKHKHHGIIILNKHVYARMAIAGQLPIRLHKDKTGYNFEFMAIRPVLHILYVLFCFRALYFANTKKSLI